MRAIFFVLFFLSVSSCLTRRDNKGMSNLNGEKQKQDVASISEKIIFITDQPIEENENSKEGLALTELDQNSAVAMGVGASVAGVLGFALLRKSGKQRGGFTIQTPKQVKLNDHGLSKPPQSKQPILTHSGAKEELPQIAPVRLGASKKDKEIEVEAVWFDFIGDNPTSFANSFAGKEKTYVVISKDKKNDFIRRMISDFDFVEMRSLQRADWPASVRDLDDGFSIILVQKVEAKPPVKDSRGIENGRLLPTNFPGGEGVGVRIRSTQEVASMEEGALKGQLKKESILRITRVEGDGNCGLYALYGADRLHNGKPIGSKKDIDAWVEGAKQEMIFAVAQRLTNKADQDIEIFRNSLRGAIRDEVERLENLGKSASFKEQLTAVKTAEKTIKELAIPLGQAKSLLIDAEIAQTKAIAAQKAIEDLNKPGQKEALNRMLAGEDASELAGLYQKWIIEFSPTKMDAIGLKVLSEDILRRPIWAVSASGKQEFGASLGKNPAILVNKDEHWDLGHRVVP